MTFEPALVPAHRPPANAFPISSAPPFPIIVHSHLAWDWVWQRPQQFHSRLSRTHPVLFVEAPIPDEKISSSQLSIREVPDYPNLIVIQIRVPKSRWADGDWVDKE